MLAFVAVALYAPAVSTASPLPGTGQVAAGGSQTCAIRDDGTLACWGDDSAGQLDEVPSGTFRSLSAGGAHTCAIRTDGTLACWGEDSAGQLYEPPEESDPTYPVWFHLHHHHSDRHQHHPQDDPPPEPPPPPKFISVAAGDAHTCAVSAAGELSCWGDDSAGQLDEIPAGEFVSVSAGGSHSC